MEFLLGAALGLLVGMILGGACVLSQVGESAARGFLEVGSKGYRCTPLEGTQQQ